MDFGSFDILSDDDVRAGLKVYSDWPTFPQVTASRFIFFLFFQFRSSWMVLFLFGDVVVAAHTIGC